MHILGGGSALNAYTEVSSDLIVQSDTGGRNIETGAQLEFVIPANSDGNNLWGQGRIITVAGSTANLDATGKMIMGTRRQYDKLGVGTHWYYGDDLTIDGSGNVGIGIKTPAGKAHIQGRGSALNAYTEVSGDLIVQSNTGGRNIETGAQLEFVIPANGDGGNMWGQGRIITVAGNTASLNATGKMILGTRRQYDKLGDGTHWYYGDDLTIDGSGNVGIGTTNPAQKLTVKGTVYTTEVKVDLSAGSGPDYVFEKDYTLPSLESVKTYIDQNKHLPEVPSAKEMEANGINLSEMNMLLLKKVEELTLYILEQEKRIQKLENK